MNGAIPSLGEEFSTPGGDLKSKTNVGKFTALAVVLLAFLFVVAGVMLYFKTQQPTSAPTSAPAASVPPQPAFAEKNAEIEAAAIEKEKAKIREEDRQRAEQEAKQKKEAEERRAREEIERKAWAMTNNNAAARNPDQMPEESEDDEARAMRTEVLLPLTGTPRKMEKGSGGGNNPVGIGDEQQRQRELEARLRRAGVDSSSGGGGSLSGDGDSLAGRLKSSYLPAVAAGRLQNLTYLLKKGTTIPCSLKTGIDTQLPGFVSCIVINDVYSANGQTLLIERGATLFGEQQSSLRQGQERTFVIWSRVDNPSGITAALDSPAVDNMGYSGVPGIIDNHFWKRFGSAILLSSIQDFSKAAADRFADRNNGVRIGASDDVNTMAVEALKSTVNIPPTLIVKPATVVHVMVARDVSFEGIYMLVK